MERFPAVSVHGADDGDAKACLVADCTEPHCLSRPPSWANALRGADQYMASVHQMWPLRNCRRVYSRRLHILNISMGMRRCSGPVRSCGDSNIPTRRLLGLWSSRSEHTHTLSRCVTVAVLVPHAVHLPVLSQAGRL